MADVSSQNHTPTTRTSDHGAVWRQRPFAFELHLGIATPLGGLGVMFDAALSPAVSLACGVGTNFVGPEVACMVRPRIVLGPGRAFTFGAGASGGPHTQTTVTRWGLLTPLFGPMESMGERKSPNAWHSEIAYWANLEIGLEQRSRSGFVVRGYVGLSQMLNPNDATARRIRSENTRELELMQTLAYGGLALGVTF